ncbi:GM26916 [Drosophila sechellia]|uniref:GM26916 n=1 Tax=Drosophila sechellia TaxID=7238 RepID=B4IHX0_DROSE|nr:GM26916 [Drosophila sechellia]
MIIIVNIIAGGSWEDRRALTASCIMHNKIRCTHHNVDVNGDEDTGAGEGTGGRIDWAEERARWRAGK